MTMDPHISKEDWLVLAFIATSIAGTAAAILLPPW